MHLFIRKSDGFLWIALLIFLSECLLNTEFWTVLAIDTSYFTKFLWYSSLFCFLLGSKSHVFGRKAWLLFNMMYIFFTHHFHCYCYRDHCCCCCWLSCCFIIVIICNFILLWFFFSLQSIENNERVRKEANAQLHPPAEDKVICFS